MERYDVAIIGGGFFGCSLALHLKTATNRVLVLEKEEALMSRASYNNQARAHGGYHYSRSLLTALRSRVNLADFVSEYGETIDDSFEKYYAISRTFSKVSAHHFHLFCKRIGADVDEAPAHIKKLFNDDLVENVFKVKEYAFDSIKLRKRIEHELAQTRVSYRLATEVEKIWRDESDDIALEVVDKTTNAPSIIRANQVFNCTYAHINKINFNSGLPFIPLKHELAELALVEMPEELRNIGITVMDGPFFSVMPFPPRHLHTLSHVRYTPHVEWHDKDGSWRNGHQYLSEHTPPSAFKKMLADAQRYVPLLGKATYADSLWEVKTVLPTSEHDDSRPILFAENHGGMNNYTVIMGGKIDNIRDVLVEVDGHYEK